MSGIKKRTVFCVVDDNHTMTGQTPVYKFEDWATVVTGVGQCAEPFLVNNKISGNTKDDEGQTNWDPEDMIAMINKIEYIEKGTLSRLLGGGPHLNGTSPQAPRAAGKG